MNSVVLLLLINETLLGTTLYIQAIMCKVNASYKGLTSTEISVDPGQPLVINCTTVLGNRAESIVWSWRETQMRLASTEDGSPGRWAAIIFGEVTLHDVGIYECWATEKASKQKLCQVTLHVNFAPELLKTQGHYTTSPQLVYAGTNPVFHCYASGWPKPTITWLRNSTEIRNGDKGSFLLDRNEDGVDLEILSVSQKEHAGRYTCLAENEKGKRRYVIKVQVESLTLGLPPKVSAITSNVTARKGSHVNLTCTAENTMEIRTVLFWMFNGSKIPEQKETWRYYTDGHIPKVNFSLALSNVTESDTGDYYCVATTTHGQDRKKVCLRLVKMKGGGPNAAKKRTKLTMLIIGSASLVSGLGLIAFIACRLRLKRQRNLRRLETKEYQYDLFVSFSGSDFDWVKEKLMPLLEKQQIKYCIHYRDFEVGKAIIENIADSVYNSKKVLAVVSENYMTSKFCREELEIALYRSCIEKADSSLLLIKLDDISKKKLPRPLRRMTFLDYTNYSERKSWERRLLQQIQGEDRARDTKALDDCKVHLIADDDDNTS